MPINPHVCNPERIASLEELDIILATMGSYHREYTPRDNGVGVVLIQNMQLGGSHEIVSEEEANAGLIKPMVAEWYVQFYPKKYFEELRKAFESGKKPDYAELERHAIKR